MEKRAEEELRAQEQEERTAREKAERMARLKEEEEEAQEEAAREMAKLAREKEEEGAIIRYRQASTLNAPAGYLAGCVTALCVDAYSNEVLYLGHRPCFIAPALGVNLEQPSLYLFIYFHLIWEVDRG